ncbi:Hypothetical predicted protein [Olea europaea subsp. europaea]|uniref:Uncharacterized protein n=1 Tax=Olea europaea subsp. europaea TaxID=158383 RepID=A0A8S0SHF2_OLEEU|nr:Hypothetical predicted protein [Olea europaea subsp. europaea]
MTLRDWLVDSPSGLNGLECIVGDEIQVLTQPNKVYLSSPDHVHTGSFTPRVSFSMGKQKLDKIDESKEEEEDLSMISQNGNLKKKRVRFTLPEEADIIIFHSPKEIFEEQVVPSFDPSVHKGISMFQNHK